MKTTEAKNIKDIKDVFSRKWPGYRVIGNKPYSKGVWVIEIGPDFQIVRICDSNYQLWEEMNKPGFHPKPSESKTGKTLYERGMFPEAQEARRDAKVILLNRMRDLVKESHELLDLFGSAFETEVSILKGIHFLLTKKRKSV